MNKSHTSMLGPLRGLAVLATAVTLAACGGGAASVSPSGQHASASAVRTAQATFTIKWTNATAPASVRHRDTISPSAQSFTISINGAVAAITNRTSGSSTQSVAINAPVGSDLFVFNIYDGVGGQGNLLGTASVVQQIVDGTANTVTASIQAVCAATNVTSVGNDPLAHVRTGVTGVLAPTVASIVLAGQSTANLIVDPEDADGNVIVSGSGGTVSHSISGSATVTVIDSTHISLTPVSGPRTTTPDTLTVAVPTCPQTAIAVQQSPAIYAQGANAVGVYDTYGDSLVTANIAPDTIIGYDSNLKAIMTVNFSGQVSAYTLNFSHRTPQFSAPSNYVVWSNDLHSVVGIVPTGTNPYYQVYAYVGGNTDDLGSRITPSSALGASPLSTSPYAFSAPSGTAIASYNLATLSVINGDLANQYTAAIASSFAVDDADNSLYVFFGTSTVQQYTPLNLSGTPTVTTGSFGFNSPVTYGAVDTDGDNLVGLSATGSVYVSSGTAQLAGFSTNVGAGSALVVLSTNTH